jgi:RNA recognition motif-containing protein
MESKLYVGNLSFNTTEENLRQAFSEFGTIVSVDMIKDRETGQTKGFAFVSMSSQVEAENAIKTMNGKMLDGRDLRVNIARPREETPPREGNGGNRRY